MKFCPYCGADLLKEDAAFCAECGKKLSVAEEAPSPAHEAESAQCKTQQAKDAQERFQKAQKVQAEKGAGASPPRN